MTRLRAVKHLAPLTSTAAPVTAVVFDLTDSGRTSTFGLAVRDPGESAVTDDWDGLVPLEEVKNAVLQVKVGSALRVQYVFVYGVVTGPPVTSVRNVTVTHAGRTQEFSGPVCDGVFALMGRWTGPPDGLLTNRLEFTPAVGTTVLSIELDPGPID